MLKNKIKNWVKNKAVNEIKNSQKMRLDESLSWACLYKHLYNESSVIIDYKNLENITKPLKSISYY